jgi:hypothetical protein
MNDSSSAGLAALGAPAQSSWLAPASTCRAAWTGSGGGKSGRARSGLRPPSCSAIGPPRSDRSVEDRNGCADDDARVDANRDYAFEIVDRLA